MKKMLKKDLLEKFLNKRIVVIYKDFNMTCRAKGILRAVSEDSLVVETAFNLLTISASQILKIKIPLERKGE
jgi:hypothetical protein